MPRIKFTNEVLDATRQQRILRDWSLYRRFLDLQARRMSKSDREWEQAIDEEAQQIANEDARSEFYEYHSEEYEDRLQLRGILMY